MEQFDSNLEDFVSSDEINKIKDKLNIILPEETDREKYLGSYSSFIGSLQEGKFQFDLWSYNNTDKDIIGQV